MCNTDKADMYKRNKRTSKTKDVVTNRMHQVKKER